MRTIKFRGKNKETGKWEYGDLVQCIYDDIKIVNSNQPKEMSFRIIDIQSNTLGQFTGLVDKNGKEIYEGDIIKIEDECVILKPKVVDFNNGMFGSGEWSLAYYGEDIIEVIGNIHDNPELLKNND